MTATRCTCVVCKWLQVLPQCNIAEEKGQQEEEEEEEEPEPPAPSKRLGSVFGRTQKVKAGSQVCVDTM